MTEYLDMADDLLRGVAEIAGHFGRKQRTIQYMLSKDLVPGAFKLGRVWHLRRSTNRRLIGEIERRAAEERRGRAGAANAAA